MDKIRKTTYAGLLIAITTITTMILVLPVPGASGYIHVGDGVILLICFFFGPFFGVIAASVGSLLADVFTGFAQWALFTMIVKGAMALCAAKLFDRKKPVVGMKNMTAAVVSEAVMVVGYYLFGILLLGGPVASLQGVPTNLVQAAGGVVMFAVCAAGLKRTRVMDSFRS